MTPTAPPSVRSGPTSSTRCTSDTLAGGGGEGLRFTFLLALSTLLVSAACLQWARRFYPRELAAAKESLAR